MDVSLTEEVMYELTCLTPVSQVGKGDLWWMIKNFTEVMIEGSGESDDMSEDRLEQIHRGSRILFMRHAETHPDAPFSEIMRMCLDESKNVTHLKKCMGLKPARNTKGFGNS